MTHTNSENANGHLLTTGNFYPTYTEKKFKLFISSWRAHAVFLDVLFVQLMLNTAGHELSKTVKKFLSCEGFSFLSTLSSRHCSPLVCLTYRQTQPATFLSPSPSLAYPKNISLLKSEHKWSYKLLMTFKL